MEETKTKCLEIELPEVDANNLEELSEVLGISKSEVVVRGLNFLVALYH